MRTTLSILALLGCLAAPSTACGGPRTDPRVHVGKALRPLGAKKLRTEVKAIASMFCETLADGDLNMEAECRMLQGHLDIKLRAHDIKYLCPGPGRCLGMYYAPSEIRMWWRPKTPRDTARTLLHELLHHWLWKMSGRGDFRSTQCEVVFAGHTDCFYVMEEVLMEAYDTERGKK